MMKVTGPWTVVIISGACLTLGCSSFGGAASPPGQCQDRTRFGYPESFSQDQVDLVPDLMLSLGLEGAEPLPIPGDRPRMLNRQEVAQVLEREYPPNLRREGISGTSLVAVLVAESGKVDLVQILESSGHPELDQAAMRVAMQFEFTRYQSEDRPICWGIGLPISFATR